MDKLLGNIDRQIEFNKGKNFFIDKPNFSLQFMEETRNTIENFGIINEAYENRLIDYSTHKVMDEFCRINQYFSFNNESKVDLRNIYVDLFSNIKMKNVTVDGISNRHYRNLKLWLQKTNPFAEEIYSGKDVILKPVVCAEYSAELQMEILQIDLSKLMEPVLDIGCGKQGELVEFLRSNGFETYGIDRLSFDNSNLMEADWLDFDYGTQKWGTVISNLGFSNHFQHHHFRKDGNFLNYAKKYMDIVRSLKLGGSFHYAPDLPFVEKYLDLNLYQQTKQKVRNYNFVSAKITSGVLINF